MPNNFWQQLTKPHSVIAIGLSVLLISIAGLWLTGNSEASDQAQAKKQLAQVQTVTESSQTTTTDQTQKPKTSTSTKKAAEDTTNKQPTDNEPTFNDLSLTAESALVWDVREDKPIFTYNPKKEQPLASLTKLMTALVAIQEYTGNATTTINSRHLDAHGEYGLVEGQVWSLDQLIDFMLIESANDAARAVATAGKKETAGEGYSKEFVETMNQTATDLNMTDTYFFNPSGLDINEDLISGGYGTAKDITQLFAYIQKHYPDILQSTHQTKAILKTENGVTHTAENTNDLVNTLPHTTGSKTGYTVLAGGNLIMGFDLTRPVIITVLGSTKDGRFADMTKLYNHTRQYLQNKSFTRLKTQQ